MARHRSADHLDAWKDLDDLARDLWPDLQDQLAYGRPSPTARSHEQAEAVAAALAAEAEASRAERAAGWPAPLFPASKAPTVLALVGAVADVETALLDLAQRVRTVMGDTYEPAPRLETRPIQVDRLDPVTRLVVHRSTVHVPAGRRFITGPDGPQGWAPESTRATRALGYLARRAPDLSAASPSTALDIAQAIRQLARFARRVLDPLPTKWPADDPCPWCGNKTMVVDDLRRTVSCTANRAPLLDDEDNELTPATVACTCPAGDLCTAACTLGGRHTWDEREWILLGHRLTRPTETTTPEPTRPRLHAAAAGVQARTAGAVAEDLVS